MSKKVLLSAIAILFVMIGTPQSVMAQNKVKKVKYLGHKYNGEVNQDKIPEGSGIMDYEVFTVEGNFDGNNITNPVFKNSQLHFDYIGNASYDESNNIVLTAGGKIEHYCIYVDKWSSTVKEVKASTIELTRDSVINAKSMNTKELTVLYEVPLNLPEEVNPPHIIISDVLKLNEYSYSEQVLGTINKYTAKGFLFNDLLEKSNNIQGYKDDKGRIWDLKNTGVSTSLEGWDVNVVYPDGSFFKGHTGTGYGNDYSRNIKIVYPNGDVLKEQDGYLSLCLNNGLFLSEIEDMRIEDFAKLYNSKIYPEFEISIITDSKGLLSGLSSQEIGKVLEEKVFQKCANNSGSVLIRHKNGESVRFDTKRHATENEIYAANQAEESKKEAAKEKALNAEINKFKSKYGFDPTLIKAGLKVGKKITTVNAWNDWLNSHGYENYSFKLSQDRGSSKCYRFYYRGEQAGFFWVKNDVITSVSWF